MTECDICSSIEKGENVLFKNENFAIIIPSTPASGGHVQVVPLRHQTILEEIPDFVIGEMFNSANIVSSALFSGLKAMGTNIIIENGTAAGQKIPHAAINVIARAPGDGLDFSWASKEVPEEQMTTVELQIKEQSEGIGDFKEEKEELEKMEKPKRKKIRDTRKKDNYLIRQLRRIP